MEKMKSAGIIAEYNPFHNGHQYHVEETRKQTGADVIIAVMSGNFTQRGEMAIADKRTRAELAVCGGADLVVEMPTVAACNHAAVFAQSGVNILQNLGADFISFGSECGSLNLLQSVADKLKENNSVLEASMEKSLKEGLSWPRARQEAMKEFLTEEETAVLAEPNNILALEYLKFMDCACPATVRREGTGYHEMEARGRFASASFIRQQIMAGEDVSSLMPQTLPANCTDTSGRDDVLFRLAVQKILTMTSEELDAVSAGDTGLGNNAKKVIRNCSSLDELAEKLKSKRYTRTRVQRFIIQILLGITRDDVNQRKDYVRVLAANEKGSRYLKQVKKAEICKLPIITNINKDLQHAPEIQDTIEKDILASDIWNLAAGRNLYKYSDFVECVRIFRQTP
jgi:predicted nucleotidyltransferase